LPGIVTAIRTIGAPLTVESLANARAIERTPRIGVLYPSGWGNLGDEAILQATFAALRARWPKASLRAFTLHPTRTAANHGVEAEPLTGVNRHLFGAPLGEGPFAVRAARALARRTQNVPLLGGITARASNLVATLVFEGVSLLSAWRWLRSADLLLASGGGQLDAVWGGAWGQPYALARWAWLARRANVPFALLSVGYGGASTWLSRQFLRYAVSGAAYCSVRDAGSGAMTMQLGVKRDLPVVPDLAFGLTPPSPFPPRRPGYDVGISPMVYLRPGSWPIENQAGYERLIALWAELVTVTVARGDRVHLFVSNPGDMPAVRDIWEQLGEVARASCTIAQAQSPNALLEFFRGMDVIISSRLHGVLLAIVAARPVLALSHDRKVRAAMIDAGVSDFCADLTTATVEEVTAMLRNLTDHLDPCARRLREYVETASSALRQQDELLPDLLKVRR
jgi:polysaccharide pyruvyl transferase WcaK-like protein